MNPAKPSKLARAAKAACLAYEEVGHATVAKILNQPGHDPIAATDRLAAAMDALAKAVGITTPASTTSGDPKS